MPDLAKLSAEHFRHECQGKPRIGSFYECAVCHRRWTKQPSGVWSSPNEGVSELASVTMRRPDGTTETFEVQG
jgi:hypothetical protein